MARPRFGVAVLMVGRGEVGAIAEELAQPTRELLAPAGDEILGELVDEAGDPVEDALVLARKLQNLESDTVA